MQHTDRYVDIMTPRNTVAIFLFTTAKLENSDWLEDKMTTEKEKSVLTVTASVMNFIFKLNGWLSPVLEC